MRKQGLVQKTVATLEKLPEEKVSEIANFADFLAKNYEEHILQKGNARIGKQFQNFRFSER